MRSVIIVALALIASLAVQPLAAADAAPKILRVQAFTGEGLTASEASAAQNLVKSYVAEYKAFRLIDAEGQELAMKEAETAVQLGAAKDIAPLTADYILSANAQPAGGLIVFTMDLTKVSTGEKRSVAKAANSVNDLILALRGLTNSLFDKAQPDQAAPAQAASTQPAPLAPAAPPPSAEAPSPAASGAREAAPAASPAASPAGFKANPTMAMLAGTWSGDKGVDRVSIFKDGRGVAILSNGTKMNIRATISGAQVIVSQDQANSPNFYKSAGIDLKAAKVIAAKARPWRWVFGLEENAATLSGVKESVFVKTEANGEISVDNGYVREARWTRLFK